MIYIILCVVGFVGLMGFVLLIHQVLSQEKHQGELEKEIEDAQHINELQKTYVDIASRPGYTPSDIIARMRGKPPANR